MTRRAILIAGTALLTIVAAVPERAEARDLLGGIIGAVSRPLHGLFGGSRYHRRPMGRSGVATPTAAAPAAAAAVAAKPDDAPAKAGARNATVENAADVPAPAAAVAWPSAYQDMLGYTFWPQDYGPRLQAHGYSDILSVAFEPGDRTGAVSTTETTGSASSNNTNAACGGDQQQSSAWPTDKIEQTLQLNDAQKKALGELRSNTTEANKAIQASCGSETGRSSAERLRSMEDRLWIVRDAGLSVRASLQTFYNSLTDDQKKQFVIEASQPDQNADTAKETAMSRRAQAQAAQQCGAQALREWPAARIEQAVRPNAAQRASLETFRKKSTEMGQLLMASCMKPTPATPLERLDRADERLTTLIYATSTVNLALNDFYGQLSAAQKAQFDGLKR